LAKRISISIDEQQLAILKSLKGYGKKEAEIVKNIMMSFLSERGYIEQFNKKRR